MNRHLIQTHKLQRQCFFALPLIILRKCDLMILSENEKNALKYYIGDIPCSSPFYSNPKAYVTLNSLFFPDIKAETARAAEGKFLDPTLISDTSALMDFFASLFSVFSKSKSEKNLRTYRVERLADYQMCREVRSTISLTSTSLAGFLESYRDRCGIALMKFTLPCGCTCINAAEILDRYAKPEEAEILLPPFTELSIEEIPVSEHELKITDIDNRPPKISCNVTSCGIRKFTGTAPELPKFGAESAEKVYSGLNSGKLPENGELEMYIEWKKALQLQLHKLLCELI